jgi:hypothetical protein
VEWEFRDADDVALQPHKKYSRDIEYTQFKGFNRKIAVDRFSLFLDPLPGSGAQERELTFKRKAGPQSITIWIGNGVPLDIPHLLGVAEAPCYRPAAHFKLLHRIVAGSDVIPYPMAEVCTGPQPMDAMSGYCGPDQLP